MMTEWGNFGMTGSDSLIYGCMCVGLGRRPGAGQWLQRPISELLHKASMTSALVRGGWRWVGKPRGWVSFVCAENWCCNTAFFRDSTGELTCCQKRIVGRCWNTKQCLMALKDRKWNTVVLIPISPGVPGGPGGPGKPDGPGNPISPGKPRSPLGPGRPNPGGPLSPGAPLVPGAPWWPVSPGGPLMPSPCEKIQFIS